MSLQWGGAEYPCRYLTASTPRKHEYPARVRRACARDKPSVVASYVLDLCRAFSSWYAQGSRDPALKVNCDDADLARARLALAQAVRRTLRNALGLLGLEAPEEM